MSNMPEIFIQSVPVRAVQVDKLLSLYQMLFDGVDKNLKISSAKLVHGSMDYSYVTGAYSTVSDCECVVNSGSCATSP